MTNYDGEPHIIPSNRRHTRRVQTAAAAAIYGVEHYWNKLHPATKIAYRDPNAPEAPPVIHSAGDFTYSRDETGQGTLAVASDLGGFTLHSYDQVPHVQAVWIETPVAVDIQ